MLLLSAVMACSDSTTTLHSTTGDAPTWHQDIAPIVSRSCVGCHAQGAIAGQLPLDSYDSAAPYATLMAAHTSTGTMPPFPATQTEECQNPWGFMYDPRLSDEQIELLSRWASGGAREGDASSAAPLEAPLVVGLPRVDQELAPATAFAVPPLALSGDVFVCVVLDPQTTSEQWLEGVALVPDDVSVVHHSVVYLDPTGQSDALAGSDGRYDCFGGPGIDGAVLLAGFAPGSPPMQVPEGAGLSVPAGSRLVVQMHYHGSDSERLDRSSLQLAWSATPPSREAYLGLYGNARSAEEGLEAGPDDRGQPEFFIPAGAVGHTERMRYPIDASGNGSYGVFLVGNHMHLVGKSMRAWIEHKEGGTSCLLDTPSWDFDWQLSYAYDVNSGASPVLHSGDTLVIECTYDNTLENPGVERALSESGLTDPVDVQLGEETLDEMCIFLGGVVPLDP